MALGTGAFGETEEPEPESARPKSQSKPSHSQALAIQPYSASVVKRKCLNHRDLITLARRVRQTSSHLIWLSALRP